jgi:hypothetical protein
MHLTADGCRHLSGRLGRPKTFHREEIAGFVRTGRSDERFMQQNAKVFGGMIILSFQL